MRAILPGTEWIVRALSRPSHALWRLGFRFLIVLDAVGLFGVMVAIGFARFGFDWPTYSRSFYLGGFAIACAIHIVINYLLGLYEREPRLGKRPWMPRTLVATGIGVGIQLTAFVFFDRYLMPRLNLAIFALAGAVVLAGNRHLSRVLSWRRQGPPRVVLAGSAADIAVAAIHIAATEREVEVVGHVERLTELDGAVHDNGATDVLLLGSTSLDEAFPEPLTSLEARGVGFLKSVAARDTLLGLRSVHEVAGMPFVPLLIHSIPAYKARLKRLFDLTLTIVTAPITVPVLAALAVYVLACAGWPVLYRQRRVGRDGELFTVVKFRTMVRDAELTGPQLSTARDPRVVRGLQWVRDMRLDELPQLWNVLRNQMSLVGPRPERPELTTDIERHVAGWVRRHQLPPGLTGLAQVNGRYATSAEFKIGYDLQYIVNWSPVLDLQIIAKTIWVVLSRRV